MPACSGQAALQTRSLHGGVSPTLSFWLLDWIPKFIAFSASRQAFLFFGVDQEALLGLPSFNRMVHASPPDSWGPNNKVVFQTGVVHQIDMLMPIVDRTAGLRSRLRAHVPRNGAFPRSRSSRRKKLCLRDFFTTERPACSS